MIMMLQALPPPAAPLLPAAGAGAARGAGEGGQVPRPRALDSSRAGNTLPSTFLRSYSFLVLFILSCLLLVSILSSFIPCPVRRSSLVQLMSPPSILTSQFSCRRQCLVTPPPTWTSSCRTAWTRRPRWRSPPPPPGPRTPAGTRVRPRAGNRTSRYFTVPGEDPLLAVGPSSRL